MSTSSDSEIYEVSRIWGRRRCPETEKIQFCVHWKGYTYEESTWENEPDLEGATEEVNKFLEEQRLRNSILSKL